jgi:hypothetical protein
MAWRLAGLAPRRHDRRTALIRFVILVSLAGAFLALPVFKSSGTLAQRDEVVTVLTNEAGWRGWSQGRYVHRVRFPDDTVGRLTLSALYTPGDRVHVVYSRNRWGYVTVFMHNRTNGNVGNDQPQQDR